jgi:chromosome partitioning protein
MASIKPVVAFLTMKGGVGKTTLAANLTRAIADTEKRKILLIDADAQCNLSQLFCPAEDLDNISTRTVYEALAGHKYFGPADLKWQIYRNSRNGSEIDFIRGSFETFRLAVDATPLLVRRTAERFQEFIKDAQREYDIIAIDTNPSATLVTMHALLVSNFLIAPITFDKFSMRGVDLITSLLSRKYDWLTNPLRVRIVPNRIKRPSTDGDRQRLLDAESKVRKVFPDLSRSIVPRYIRQSAIISNEVRQNGFVADQRVPNPEHLAALLSDFDEVAIDLLATFRRAFGDAKEEQRNSISSVRDKLKSLFAEPVVRH